MAFDPTKAVEYLELAGKVIAGITTVAGFIAALTKRGRAFLVGLFEKQPWRLVRIDRHPLRFIPDPHRCFCDPPRDAAGVTFIHYHGNVSLVAETDNGATYLPRCYIRKPHIEGRALVKALRANTFSFSNPVEAGYMTEMSAVFQGPGTLKVRGEYVQVDLVFVDHAAKEHVVRDVRFIVRRQPAPAPAAAAVPAKS